jgi:hypothetical protein
MVSAPYGMVLVTGPTGSGKTLVMAMLIATLSLSGIPPLGGFWSKDAILSAILEVHGTYYTLPLFVLASATALITVFYTFRMIGMIFHGHLSPHLQEFVKEGDIIKKGYVTVTDRPGIGGGNERGGSSPLPSPRNAVVQFRRRRVAGRWIRTLRTVGISRRSTG